MFEKTGGVAMMNLLKAAAALAIVWGLSHYTVSKVMGEALEISKESAEAFKLEGEPVEIGDLQLDADWPGKSGSALQPGTAAGATARPRSPGGIDYGTTRYSPPRRTGGGR